MQSDRRTKAQLLSELADLRQRVAELEISETGRKRTEERLRLQSAALEAAANGIVITDQAGTVLWTNPAFTALTGYTTEETIGQNLRLLKSNLHDVAFYRTLWQTIQSGQV